MKLLKGDPKMCFIVAQQDSGTFSVALCKATFFFFGLWVVGQFNGFTSHLQAAKASQALWKHVLGSKSVLTPPMLFDRAIGL